MNFLEGTVEVNGSGRRFRAAGLEQPLPDAVPAAVADRKVVLGVRAEHVLVGNSGALRGTTQLTEPLGDMTLVYFDYGQKSPLVAKVGPATPLQPGTPLSFGFAADRCHLFDAGSGARLF